MNGLIIPDGGSLSPELIKRVPSCPGEIVGGTYRLLDCIGAGGMGKVYRAEHLRLKRHFAIKLLSTNRGTNAAERFRQEVEAIARVEHEHVVGVLDCGETGDGTPYLVMELLRGEDLRSLLDRVSPMPVRRAAQLIRQAALGLSAVHRAGLIHRDLKPENLFVARRCSGEDWCKILDFGVVKTSSSNLTLDGALVGTARYMAPEQLRHGHQIGSAIDIYSLGAILYECLTGFPAHDDVSREALMFKIINERPRPLREYRPEVPGGLSAVVERALAKSSSDRFDTAEDFAAALAAFVRDAAPVPLVETTNPDSTTTLQPPPRRRRLTKALVLASTLISIGLLAWQLTGSRASAARSAPVHQTTGFSGSGNSPAGVLVPTLTSHANASPAPVLASSPTCIGSSPLAPPTRVAPSRPITPSRPAPFDFPHASFESTNPYVHP